MEIDMPTEKLDLYKLHKSDYATPKKPKLPATTVSSIQPGV